MDTVNQDFLIAKLDSYDFHNNSLKHSYSYLTKRWQKTKINTSFTLRTELSKGIPQGSVLGLILFNIYLNHLFYLVELIDIDNFADATKIA